MKGLFSPARLSRSSILWAAGDAAATNAAFDLFYRGTFFHAYRDTVIIAGTLLSNIKSVVDGVHLVTCYQHFCFRGFQKTCTSNIG